MTGYRPLWRALRRALQGRRQYGHGRGLTQVVQQLVLHGPPVALAQGGRSVVGRHVWSLSAEASTSSASAMYAEATGLKGADRTTGRFANVLVGTRRDMGTRVSSSGSPVPSKAPSTSLAARPALSHAVQATPTRR